MHFITFLLHVCACILLTPGCVFSLSVCCRRHIYAQWPLLIGDMWAFERTSCLCVCGVCLRNKRSHDLDPAFQCLQHSYAVHTDIHTDTQSFLNYTKLIFLLAQELTSVWPALPLSLCVSSLLLWFCPTDSSPLCCHTLACSAALHASAQ